MYENYISRFLDYIWAVAEGTQDSIENHDFENTISTVEYQIDTGPEEPDLDQYMDSAVVDQILDNICRNCRFTYVERKRKPRSQVPDFQDEGGVQMLTIEALECIFSSAHKNEFRDLADLRPDSDIWQKNNFMQQGAK
jgi:hypothetical protein